MIGSFLLVFYVFYTKITSNPDLVNRDLILKTYKKAL